MRTPLYLLFATACVFAIGGPASAEEGSYLERKGFFAGVAVGGAYGNFDLDKGTGIYSKTESGDTNTDRTDFGGIGEIHAGWAFTDRLGASAGISSALFTYDRDSNGVLENGGLGATALEYTFTMYDVSLWYWHPIQADTSKFFVRLGGGATDATEEVDGDETKSESGSGFLAGLGFEYFAAKRLALTIEGFFKTYGVSDTFMNGKTEIATVGILFGGTYR